MCDNNHLNSAPENHVQMQENSDNHAQNTELKRKSQVWAGVHNGFRGLKARFSKKYREDKAETTIAALIVTVVIIGAVSSLIWIAMDRGSEIVLDAVSNILSVVTACLAACSGLKNVDKETTDELTAASLIFGVLAAIFTIWAFLC